MEISQVWLDLADAGITITLPQDHGSTRDRRIDVILEGPTWPQVPYQVKLLDGPLRPSVLNRHAHESHRHSPDSIGMLIIASAATDSSVLRAARLGISVIVAPEGPGHTTTGLLVHPQTRLMLAVGAEPSPTKAGRPGRPGWATFAVAITLLEAPASTQNELAERCGITQGRVSTILKVLGPFWTRGLSGVVIEDPFGLSQWLADEYPQRSKLETAWLTVEALVPMAKRIADHLDDRQTQYAISGDVAADVIAPWANPTVLKIYAPAPLDLTEFGLTPAPRDVANVIVDVPADPYTLSTRQSVDGVWLASPWRVWLDLVADGRVDAADALRKRLIQRMAR